MYLIIYDITETSLRTRVAKLLIREGFERIQLSVFIGHFSPEENNVWSKLASLMKETPNNKIFYLRISTESFYAMKIIGNFQPDFDYLSGKKRSLIV
ncbi:MAG: CRISPR-associated endonuclease Cas2 [Flavobacteriales bacterium]|nr:CRISPR-associated endonuclease Cas2 [Flavobacteriales bacterium]